MASNELFQLAQVAARDGGQLALSMRDAARQSPKFKTSVTDLVTEADFATQDLISNMILDARPQDAFLGEEGSSGPGTSGVRWIVDPIDGTHNYVRGSGPFGVSIGVEIDGELSGGAIYAPLDDELFAAWDGEGATCNGKEIHVAALEDPSAAMISFDGPTFEESRAGQIAVLSSLVRHNGLFRRIGSSVVSFSWVAAGRLDGYIGIGNNPWDIVAGIVIAREAGAHVESLLIAGQESTIAGVPEITKQLASELSEV